MDLRTIMNSDSAGVPSKPPQAQPPPSPLQPRTREPSPRRASYPNETSPNVHPSHPTEPRVRPPPPPPLQPPLHSPGRSSSYGSAQSPYQHSSASSILSGIPPPPNAPSYSQGSQSFLPVARDSFAATSAPLPHPTSSLCSPFTPQPLSSGTQQTYFSQARSHSIHSVTTPSSVRSFSFPAPREEAGTAQPAELPQSLPYSPNQAGSQPATPLGPPSASLKRPSLIRRVNSSGLDADHAPLPAHGTDPISKGSKRNQYRLFFNRKSHGSDHLWRTNCINNTCSSETSIARGPATTTNNPAPLHESDPTSQSLYPPTTPKTSHPSNSSHPSTVSPTSKQQFRRETDLSFQHQDIPMKITDQPAPPSVASSFVPRKKRKRYHEPPIYAQKAPRTTGTPPAIPTRYKSSSSFPFKPPFPKRENPDDRPVSRNRSMPPRQAPTPQSTRSDVNGNAARSSTAGDSTSSLGPWEPSITGVIPHEEVTKLICDFLFQQVVMRKDIGAGPAGGSATGSGAILEVEAKLGQLVDKNRGERVRLPVLTECIISRDDPSMRIAFESSMTLAQHRSLNNFLNESVKSSMGPGSSRIPITYAHKKERDTFYEISSSALPPIVQHHLNPRHKPKVRVTTDQRTGAILARIIKCRIADLDVYSPRTNLDWRISVNLEMNYEGDINELIPASDAGNFGGRAKSRNKDRMSYRHLAYQIDLTQVATAEANNPPNPQADFEHELEIEISSAEIRRQGDLALAGDLANQYEELVKGFVDNVRVLARAVPGR
ncbi:hypothetical protein CISG_07613 [Coccidioides immitis RMSCC 3703]|uniref:mRNA-capping enzyme subunit beta n=1 Tax=Coccidioides immitis RMSCC 3703 TaxID=454286 RepID=A0A0J8R3M3_COCIT|nr:hypothetical protein CISG_07613 [Coccidioides immitis RMSCC 3703]